MAEAESRFPEGSSANITEGSLRVIYTQCKSICLSLGDVFQQTQAEIIEKSLDKKLGLVSISFDVEHESPSLLQAYRKRMHADPDVWSLLTMKDTSVLETASDKIMATLTNITIFFITML